MAESEQGKEGRLRRRGERRRAKPKDPGESAERRAERADEEHRQDAAKEPSRWEWPPYGIGG
jgi:hypothetical protein